MTIYDEQAGLIVYCDCCGKECTDNHEVHEDMDICFDCLQQNAQENLCNIQ